MNNRKIVGIIIILVGVVAIVGIIYMLFFSSPKVTSPATEEPTSTTDSPKTEDSVLTKNIKTPARKIQANITNQQNTNNNPVVAPVEEEVTKDDLKRIASSFVERFGSYSNQSNYSNIKDLKMFMSSKMKIWADDFVAEQNKKQSANNLYFGIITKSITEEVLTYDDAGGNVSIMVDTRRREAVGTSANFSEVFNQRIQVNYVKEKGVWKVDSANWQEK